MLPTNDASRLLTFKSTHAIHEILLRSIPANWEDYDTGYRRLMCCKLELDEIILKYGNFTTQTIKDLIAKINNEITYQQIELHDFKAIDNGRSGNSVFQIELSNGLRYILKLVPYDNPRDFFAEVVSLLKLQAFSSVRMSTATLLNIGYCILDQSQYYVITQSYVSGIPIGSLLSQLVRAEHFSERRDLVLGEAITAFESFGVLLAKFHLENYNNGIPFYSSRFINIIDADLDKFVKKISTISNTGINIASLNNLIEQELSNFRKLKEISGYMFLDPHFGNVFWEKNQRKISLIDTSTCFYSFGDSDYGCGLPNFDIFLITEFFLELKKVKFLYSGSMIFTNKEILLIKDAFIRGYTGIRNYEITKEQTVLYTLLHVAWYMNWFIDQKFFTFSLIDIADEDKKRWISVHFYLDKLRQLLDDNI